MPSGARRKFSRVNARQCVRIRTRLSLCLSLAVVSMASNLSMAVINPRYLPVALGLSDFIAANESLIVDECEAFARTLGPVAEDMNREALRDHLGEILGAIAQDMKVPQTESERKDKSEGQLPSASDKPDVAAAQTHGALRAASGFDITQTAAEYRALRASVIRLWLSTSPSSR